MPYISIDVNFI